MNNTKTGYILALESSTDSSSVALHQKGRLIAYLEDHTPRAHSTSLPLMLKHLCQQEKINIEALDGVAISEGPGSYTGLRIGASIAKGICYSKELPLIALPTPQLVVEMAKSILSREKHPKTWYVLLDARREHIYATTYDKEGKLTHALHSGLVKQLQEQLKENANKQPTAWIGSGAEAYASILEEIVPQAYLYKGFYPSARYMGALAWEKWKKQDSVDLKDFIPNYTSAFAASTSC